MRRISPVHRFCGGFSTILSRHSFASLEMPLQAEDVSCSSKGSNRWWKWRVGPVLLGCANFKDCRVERNMSGPMRA